MTDHSEAVEACTWAEGAALDLLTHPEARRALFRALEALDKSDPAYPWIVELTRSAVMVRSLRAQLDNTNQRKNKQ